MNGTTILLWIIIFFVGVISIVLVKLHFKDAEFENNERSIISKGMIGNLLSNNENNEPKNSLHKDTSRQNKNHFVSESEAFVQEDYGISTAPKVDNNNYKNIEYESQNQVLINYENEVKKTQEPMNEYQVEIMTQDNEKTELKDLFTIDELIKESKRKDSEREKEAQVKNEDDEELNELKESIKKQKEAKEVDDKLIDEILADEEIGKLLEEDAVEEVEAEEPKEETIADIISTETEEPKEETIADIISTEETPEVEEKEESVQDVLDVETKEETIEEFTADSQEEIENQSVASQKDIEEAINTASQEIEEKETESISESENITDALLNSDEEIKEPALKSPTKITESTDDSDDSDLYEEPANELDYRNDLNKIKKTIRGSKLFQDVKERLKPETPEYDPINDLEETYIRNVNEYEDEYAPIINETHDEFGEYYEPDYDEAIRQENTRKLFETTTPEKPKIEIATPKVEPIKPKPSRGNIKIQLGNTEVVLKKGDEIIFKHDGETYSSQVYAINGDDISVRYRRKDITIKPEDVKKVY